MLFKKISFILLSLAILVAIPLPALAEKCIDSDSGCSLPPIPLPPPPPGCTPANATCPASTAAAAEFTCGGGGTATSEYVAQDASVASWICAGSCGGTNSGTCYAYSVLVNGACSSASVADTCDWGNPNNYQISGSTGTWICTGLNGGAPSGTCTATVAAATKTNGACNNSVAGQCISGIATSITYPTATSEQWICAGENGGTNSGTCGPITVGLIGQPPEPASLGIDSFAISSGAPSNKDFAAFPNGYPIALGTTSLTGTAAAMSGTQSLGLTIYPQSPYSSTYTGTGNTLPGQIVVEQPLILRGNSATNTCSETENVGALRFNSTTKNFEGCNGTGTPFTPLGPTRTCTTAGCYMVLADGTTMEWFTGIADASMYNRNPITVPLPLPLTNILQAQVTTMTYGSDYGEMPIFSVNGYATAAGKTTGIIVYNARNADHGGMTIAPMIYLIGW